MVSTAEAGSLGSTAGVSSPPSGANPFAIAWEALMRRSLFLVLR